VLAYAVQFGQGDHPTKGSLLPAFLMIFGSAVVGGLLLYGLERVVPRVRRTVRKRIIMRRQLLAMATSELRSRMQMDELCPYGWHAEITVFSSAAHLPSEAPNPERVRIALDWAPLGFDAAPEDGSVRRIWAESVNLALEAMVADRITDETLQQIELRALADGAEWPDQ
jgi:hypothetical protein